MLSHHLKVHILMWKEQVSTDCFQPLQDPRESQIKAPCDSTPKTYFLIERSI